MFRYSIRSLLAQPKMLLPAFFATAVSVFFITATLQLVRGLARTISGGGSLSRVIVTSRDATVAKASQIPITAFPRLEVLPGIKRDGGVYLASAELLLPARARSSTTKLVASYNVRGVDGIAYLLHPEVHPATGRTPQVGTNDAMVGRMLDGRFDGLVPGGSARLGRSHWKIDGAFTAPGSVYESEVWVDRAALTESAQVESFSIFTAELESPDAFPAFAAAVESMRDLKLVAMTEHAFNARRLAALAPHIGIAYALVLVLAFGAIFAGLSAMYASYLVRVKELATLLAIGFSRSNIAGMLLFESIGLSTVATAFGLVASLAIVGHAFSYPELGLVYSARAEPTMMMMGAGIGLTIGAIGGAIAAAQTLRTDVLGALSSQ